MTIAYTYGEIPIFALIDRPGDYETYPSCQRDYVWKPWQQERLIDTMLRHLPIPPITVIPVENDLSGVRFWIVDGQQRLRTIQRFTSNEFRTAKRFNNEPELPPVAPGLYYSELPAGLKRDFDIYPLQMCKVFNVDVKQTGIVYRRLQYSSPLLLSERLYSYDGTTKNLAEMLNGHSFWRTIYSGDTKRKQIFQAGILIVLMEKHGIFANMTTPRLVDILNAKNTWAFSVDEIKDNLDMAERVFYGAAIKSITQVIPVYQCVMLLKESGYRLIDAPSGCLSVWLMSVRNEASEERSQFGARDVFAKLTKVSAQREFWRTHLDTVCNAVGCGKRDDKRYFDEKARVEAWIRQNGKCAGCQKDLRFQESIAHHVAPFANGGPTAAYNCQLFHDRCHAQLHISGNLPADYLNPGLGR